MTARNDASVTMATLRSGPRQVPTQQRGADAAALRWVHPGGSEEGSDPDDWRVATLQPRLIKRPRGRFRPPAVVVRALTKPVADLPGIRPRFASFLPWLALLSVGLGLVEVAGGLILDATGFIAVGILTLGFAGILTIARVLFDRGRGVLASWLVAVSIGISAFVGTLLVPGIDEAMALMPVLGIAILLPHASGRARILAVLVAVVSTILVIIGADLGSPTPLAQPIGRIFSDAVLLVVVGLVVVVLLDFREDAARNLGALETSVTREQVLTAERVALGRVLDSLTARETVEATAAAIAAALVTLPGINVGGVLEYHEGGLRVIGLAAPTPFSLQVGDEMPEAYAQSLLASSVGGPWSQPARELSGPADPDRGAQVQLLATVYAPMRSGTELLGLVGIGTSDPRVVRHLVDDLPAVSEVAATATALLGPGLLARRETANARGQIEAIIADRAFAPVFQPIKTLADREIVAYEALTRFTDGVRPDHHFANAAAAGLGVELELVTLDAAIRGAERIPYALSLTVNVSPAVIATGERLARILRRSHHPLVLELTEHVAVSDYPELRRQLKELRVPFRIAVDDAGAGYASMTHVVELGPALVKLDISLIRGVDADPVRQALIAGMLFFSERADCRLLAEGIETEAELATLAAIGIPLGQGYLLGRAREFLAPGKQRPTPTHAGESGQA